MTSPPTANAHLPLGETLRNLLRTGGETGLSLHEVTDAVGEKGFGLVLIVLSLPSALPVPAPGYSTPFGIAIGLVALQMLIGRDTLWLPERLGRTRIKPRIAEAMLGTASRFLGRIERFIHPRQQWIRDRFGQAALAIAVLFMAALMVLPIPLTNTAPAMVIFMIGVGLSEEDGLLAIGAFFVGCLAIVLYAAIIYLVFTQGVEAIEPMKDWVKSLF